MNDNQKLRQELLNYLDHPHTHAPLAKAVADFPVKFMNKKLNGVPYTFFGLLEHIRITQHDMVDFIQNPNYQEINWPQDYWPNSKKQATKLDWDKTIAGYNKDFQTLKRIIKNPKLDLLAPIPHGQGQTILKEMIQVVDHAAYHIGEFVLMRRALGIWKP